VKVAEWARAADVREPGCQRRRGAQTAARSDGEGLAGDNAGKRRASAPAITVDRLPVPGTPCRGCGASVRCPRRRRAKWRQCAQIVLGGNARG
jgi:hypothetical protein